MQKIFLHETLYRAFVASVVSEEHLIIFFDTHAPDINCQTLVSEIVSDEFLAGSVNVEMGDVVKEDPADAPPKTEVKAEGTQSVQSQQFLGRKDRPVLLAERGVADK